MSVAEYPTSTNTSPEYPWTTWGDYNREHFGNTRESHDNHEDSRAKPSQRAGHVVLRNVEQARQPHRTITVEVGQESAQQPVQVRILHEVRPIKSARRPPFNNVRRWERPQRRSNPQVITPEDGKRFFEQTTAWNQSLQSANPTPTAKVEAPDEKQQETDPTEKPDKSGLYSFRQEDLPVAQAQGAIDPREEVLVAGLPTTERHEEGKFERYQSQALPEDDPLLHERFGAWAERFKVQASDQIGRVAQYLKTVGRLREVAAEDQGQKRRERIQDAFAGCGDLLYSLKKFGYLSATAGYNILDSATESLRSLNEKFEPSKNRRAVIGIAAGIGVVGLAGVFVALERRGAHVSHAIRGNEDQLGPRPRPRTGLRIVDPANVPADIPTPKSNLGNGINEALQTSGLAEKAHKLPMENLYPWDVAANLFSPETATPHLHEMAQRAAQAGEHITWYNTGTPLEQIVVNGSSDTRSVMDVLLRYAA